MMRSVVAGYLACLIVLLSPVLLVAQEQDTVVVDTVRNQFLPTGVRVGLDVVNIVRTQTRDDFRGWEAQADIDFGRYFLALEYGTSARNFASELAAYANDGTYWRAGVDVNFLLNDPDRNMFFVGARYGRSAYAEAMSVSREDPIWGSLSRTFAQTDVTSSWMELATGLRVRIWKVLWMGYTGRFKFGLSTKGDDEMLPHEVPGFGRTHKETTWGFNYYLMVRLPLRDAPVPESKKKK